MFEGFQGGVSCFVPHDCRETLRLCLFFVVIPHVSRANVLLCKKLGSLKRILSGAKVVSAEAVVSREDYLVQVSDLRFQPTTFFTLSIFQFQPTNVFLTTVHIEK